jgi:rod shape-determining protein MreD
MNVPPTKLSTPSLLPLNPHSFMKPPKKSFIVASLVIALLLNMMPLPNALQPWRIDWLALVLLYWGVWTPRYIGIAISFCMGIVMDVADASVLGQHAFYYTLLAFGADYLRRRVLNFPNWQQAIFAATLLLAGTFLTFVVRLMSGAAFPPFPYFLMPPISALLLWKPMVIVLQRPQRARDI